MYEKPDLYNADCMEAMKEFPDNFFDLAVVDPPYGDAGAGGGTTGSEDCGTDTKRWNRFGQRFDRYKQISMGWVSRTGGTWAEKYGKKIIEWDVAPGKEYFDELFRVSRNQIIWGGQLLRSTSDTVLPDLAKAKNQRELFNGHVRVRVDKFQREREAVRVRAAGDLVGHAIPSYAKASQFVSVDS